MKYNEVIGDLFATPQGYYLAHCISGDYALGAGIAKQFNSVYDMRYKLHKNYPIPTGERFTHVGDALLVDNVFNLVTKARSFHKPTMEDLYDTLLNMKEQCIQNDIYKLAMPRIACGLDGMSWEDVSDVIREVFEDIPIEIVIYTLPEDAN